MGSNWKHAEFRSQNSECGNRAVLRLALLAAVGAVAVAHASDSLSQDAAKRGIYIGAAVQSGYNEREPPHATKMPHEYSMIEPEYEMLWSAIHTSRTGYNWTGADKLVQYAQDHGMPLRADHLVWHSSLPSWLTNGNFKPDELSQIL